MRLVSTMGWNAEVVLEPIRILNPEEAVVFYGYYDQMNRERIEEELRRLNEAPVKVKLVRVDPFSMEDCIEKMKPHIDDGTVANITGGTKIMSFALSLLATHRKGGEIPIIYYITEGKKGKIVKIPAIFEKMKVDLNGDNASSYILRVLMNANGKKLSTKEIKEKMKAMGKNVEGSTFNQAKNNLLWYNLIKEEKQGRTKFYEVYPIAKIFVGGEEQ